MTDDTRNSKHTHGRSSYFNLHVLHCYMYILCLPLLATFLLLKVKTSSGHAIALWKKRCGIDQKRLIILHILGIGVHCKVLESSKWWEIWLSLGKVTSTVHRKMYTSVRARYLSSPYRYNNLPNISISRRLPDKICIITYLFKTCSFTWLVIRASISIFWEGGVSKTDLYL